MARRLLLIVIATAAALGLFVVTLLVGPADEGDPSGRGARREGPVEVVPEFDPGRVTTGGPLANPELLQEVRQGVYRYPDDGRTTLLFYERFTPEPHGVLEVEQPIAQVYFSPERVLEIRADACTFVAPDNQPRGGDFRGNVVVTLFETGDGSPVAFDNPDHVQLRTHLEEVTFDLDLGQLESDGPVAMTGREVTFRGRGLSMIYNELRRRIERLEIAEGELLRFTPQRQVGTVGGEAEDENDADRRVTGVTRPEEADANADADHADVDEADAPLFYRARFEREVAVDAEGGTVQIAADVLDAVFTLSSSDWNASAKRIGDGPTRYATASATDDVAVVDPVPDPADAAAPPTAEAVEHGLAIGEGDDDDRAVTIRWKGAMVLEPEPRPDAALAGPDDVLLRLIGQPARLETADGEQLAAREIEYLTSTGHVRATGTEQSPLHLRTADAGELHAIALEIDQVAGTGRVEGPGWLASAAVDNGDEADALRVAWRDRLDLRFHRSDDGGRGVAAEPGDAPLRLRSADRLAGLEAALFHGEVHVDHADFQLDAGQLALHMTAPDGDAGRQNIRTIEATDTTRLTTTALPRDRVASPARADANDAEDAPASDASIATLESGSLTVVFDVDAQGDARARQVVARDAVTVDHPDWRLAAGRVEAELAEGEIDEAVADDQSLDAGSARGNLRRLTAERDVQFTLHEDGTELAGHRMVVDIPADQLELFSDPEVEDVPARVVRPDATLAGPHLILSQLDRSVRVQGPGWLDVNLDQNDPAARLMVNWQRSMHYDDEAGTAHVVGEVNARSETPTNRTRLTSEDLRFELAAPGPGRPGHFSDQALDANDDLDAALGRREVRFATAREDALFTAETLDPDTGDRLSRLRLEGPLISFDGSAEQVQVIGPGRMLIEDNRPQTPASEEQRDDDRDDDSSPPDNPLAFTGRGATLFLWQRQLTLDAARNDVLFEQGVQMIHRPTGEQDVLQLDANRLLADMAETGGLANWTAGEAADPDLRLIRADGTVRILHAGRTIDTDHLQYTADDQIVRLWAEPGRQVHVTRRDQPTGLSAESLWWDLARDRFEARRPGPGIVPLPDTAD